MNSLPQASPRVYAEQWIANWNRKDVEAVLAHFSEDVVFTSPRAASIMSSTRLDGKAKLREYWTRALAQIRTIQFALDYVIRDGDRLSIVYTAEMDGKRIRAVEFLVFGSDGLIHQGEGMYAQTSERDRVAAIPGANSFPILTGN